MKNIIIRKLIFTDDKIKIIENKYNAKYVCDTCLKGSMGWVNFPVAVFYTEEKHPQGSNWFAMYYDPINKNNFNITDAISATESFEALQVGQDVIYSAYRHDFYHYGSTFVDGGRDYLRYSPNENCKPVKLQIIKDKLQVLVEE